jgi:putative endonuclease
MPRRDAHLTSGADAEAIAAAFLERKGLAIVRRNFRTRLGEIDLIARDGETLVFVEVRLRTSRAFGGAAESITSAKRMRLVNAARVFLAGQRSEPACRFDAIFLDALDPARIEWRQNVIEAT